MKIKKTKQQRATATTKIKSQIPPAARHSLATICTENALKSRLRRSQAIMRCVASAEQTNLLNNKNNIDSYRHILVLYANILTRCLHFHFFSFFLFLLFILLLFTLVFICICFR